MKKPLSETHPELAAEWHPSLNGDSTPDSISAGSKSRVWWRGVCGHEWQAQVGNRTWHRTGCPYCSGRLAIEGVNDLKSLNPELADQWDQLKNFPLLVETVTSASSKRVWWLCDLNHSWKAAVSDRHNGNGCPICAGREVLPGFNDLKTVRPDLAEQFDQSAKNSVSSDQIYFNSTKKYSWLCNLGHIWDASPQKRNSGRGCPFCSGNALLPGFNDLATTHPALTEEWDRSKNLTHSPESIITGSLERFWWVCKQGHSYSATINNRKFGRGCPVCTNKRVDVGDNDLSTTHPELVSEWNFSKNKLRPSEVASGSNHKIWWICYLGHEWQASIEKRTSRNQGCPICSGRTVLAGFNDLGTVNPKLASEFHPSLNEGIDIQKLSKSSHKKVWWLGDCGHSWCSFVSSRSQGVGCPICRGLQVLEGFNDLASRDPKVAKEWNLRRNDSLRPTQITFGSDKRVWWQCEFGHEWQARVSQRVKGSNCPTCAPGGFSPDKPSVLYFIHNPGLGAFKVGITNTNAKPDRLAKFSKLGWNLVRKWSHSQGFLILNGETIFFKWLRRELEIPPYLGKQDLPFTQGADETFGDTLLTELEVITKIDEIMAHLSKDQTENAPNQIG